MPNKTGVDSLILLFDAKNYSRKEISNYIAEIRRSKAAAIAVQLIFDSEVDYESDSLLRQVLLSAHNIVICSEIDDKDLSVHGSNEVFQNRKEGVLSYFVDDDGVAVDYIPLFENNVAQYIGFPHQILFAYDPEYLSNFTKLRVNQRLKINYTKQLEDFCILSEFDLKSKRIENKIVIIGDLHPGQTQYFVPDRNERGNEATCGAVVTANILIDLMRQKL